MSDGEPEAGFSDRGCDPHPNGERVEDAELSDGDVVQIGRFRLRSLGRNLGR